MNTPQKQSASAAAAANEARDAEAATDENISRALVWSLAGAVALLLVGGGALLWLNWPHAKATEQPAYAPAKPQTAPADIAPPRVPFVDITKAAGFDFVHEVGSEESLMFPETVAGGVAFLDYNGDGRLDLLLINGTYWPWSKRAATATEWPTPALYRNDGGGQFTDVTRDAGLDISVYGMGVAVGDYDNDGDSDVFISCVGPNRLFRNDDGHFTDVTEAAGVAGGSNNWACSAGWFDYDLDGDLDLVVGNYVHWTREINLDRFFRNQGGVRAVVNPRSFGGSFPTLYRNEGGDVFSDVSEEAGLHIVNEDTGEKVAKTLGVRFADVNRDRWPDMLLANDSTRNFVFINQHDGTFREAGREMRMAFGPYGKARNGMGIDIADFRNNGTYGVAIGNFSGQMTALFVSSRDNHERYSDEAIAAGIGAPSRNPLTFGVAFFDYDLDGRLDLIAANGHTEPNINRVETGQTYAQPAQLFWNAGLQNKNDFIAVGPEQAGDDLFVPLVGRGVAYGDIDGDGDLDVVLTGIGTRPHLLRNDQQLGHHWVRLRLVGRTANRDAVDAEVELRIGDTWMRQDVCPTKSYLSQCERELTFGLGEAAAVDEARVIWPGGQVQTIDALPIDQLTTVVQAETPQAETP